MTFTRRDIFAGSLIALLPVEALAEGHGISWDQTALDRLSLELAQYPVVIAARDKLAGLLKSDPLVGKMPERALYAASEIAFGQVQQILNRTVSLPLLYQNTAPSHRRAGLNIPSGKYAMSNPDTLFRSAAIDPRGRYLLTGQFRHPSAYQSIHLYGENESESAPAAGFGVLFDHDLQKDGSGRFSVAIGPEDWWADAPNRMITRAGTSNLVVRDTLADWVREVPAQLRLQRVDAEAAPPVDRAALALVIGAAIDKAAVGVLNFREKRCLATPANTLEAPKSHLSGRWALISTGNFALGQGEALLLTLDQFGADYLGVQTADLATATLEPERRSSTLNSRQARADPAGGITFILSPDDPGLENWIDTAGHSEGLIMLRWQGLERLASNLTAPVTKVVRSSDLPRILPYLAKVSPRQREAERESRLRSFQRRFALV